MNECVANKWYGTAYVWWDKYTVKCETGGKSISANVEQGHS